MSSDERALLARCRAGERAAFRELVERYQRRVYAVAQGMLHNSADAMDVTQEAFVRVHRHLEDFAGESSFYTWLYRIVVNLCIDELRRSARAPIAEAEEGRLDEAAEELAPSTLQMHPGRALDRKELRERVERALSTLTPSHRAVILLREVEGLSYTEMAEVLACSKGTIMSRLFHARRRLQAALQGGRED